MSRPSSRAVAAVGLAAFASVVAPSRAGEGPLGAVDPSAEEQLGIYEINRARHDPAAYGASIGIDLSAVAARPPLAVSRLLTGSARFHALEMFEHHYFSHVSAVTGDGPNAMAVQNGYDLFGSGLGASWGATNTIESIARGVNRYPTSPLVVKDLVIDAGVAGAGHRVHLLAMTTQFQDHREIGMGRAEGKDSFPEYGFPKLLPTRTYSIHTAHSGPGTRFVTGVVFADANGNLRYDAGEGIGGATVTIDGDDVTTLAAGGWSWRANQGTFLVTCRGGTFSGTARAFITVGADNVEVDFHSGKPAGEVDFAFDGGIPAGPTVQCSVAPALGTAPFTANAQAVGATGGAYFWEFGDGGTAEGNLPSHDFTTPGLYPVVVTGVNGSGVDTALQLVTAAGPAGAGPGTTPPVDDALRVDKAALLRKVKTPGKDQATLSGSLELPAGFAPAGAVVRVCVAGIVRTFTLDRKGKGADGQGSTLVLKAKWPAGGTGVAAGVVAKVTVTIRGDLAATMDALGLRDVTALTQVNALPFAVMLGALPYNATGNMMMTTVAGKSGKGALL